MIGQERTYFTSEPAVVPEVVGEQDHHQVLDELQARLEDSQVQKYLGLTLSIFHHRQV